MKEAAALSEHALLVLHERYLRKGESGRVVEEPDALFQRVAAAVAEPARRFGENAAFWEARFLGHLRSFRFLPNSPTLMNAGLPSGQLAACFVLPVEDDLDSIFAALARMARIHQTGGGTGFSFSRLRPSADLVQSTGGVTSGPLSFMDLFDHTTAVIRAGGRRRGANMAVLRVDHPDVEEFINAKRTPDRLQNFNLSVAVTDEFLAAVDGHAAFPLRSPRTGHVVRQVAAAELFESIVAAAWECGDPGLLFLDEINRHNPTPALGAIEATNPCGEQPLLPYESCVLGSVNLVAFAGAGDVDWQGLAEVIRDAVVFLDNVVEASCYPFPEIAAATRRTRKIGLGVMGLADLFARIGVAYDSEAGLVLGERIAEFLSRTAREASVELGQRRGSFPAFADSVWPARGLPALRNATVTCVAPTGTVSLLAGTSSGIEPYFALAMERHVLDGRTLVELSPAVLDALERFPKARAEALEIVRRTGSLREAAALPEDVRRRFPIALEIEPEMHVRMQAAFQAHVDAAVSKTVNLPADAPVGAVRRVFDLARRLRLKGVTVYRYGCRPGQTLSLVHPEARHDCRECAV
jgi:ribonucleoside-diphosphate reductase alpha chain